jgi:U6 snRNA-associated Sm-like protein LSm1
LQSGLYADVPRGIFLVRGENVLLLGEIDLDRDDDIPVGYEKGDVETVHALAKKLDRERKGRERRKVERLRGEGFEAEGVGEVLL